MKLLSGRLAELITEYKVQYNISTNLGYSPYRGLNYMYFIDLLLQDYACSKDELDELINLITNS